MKLKESNFQTYDAYADDRCVSVLVLGSTYTEKSKHSRLMVEGRTMRLGSGDWCGFRCVFTTC